MDDLVSIIMPNYNCEKYLPETLKSVKDQTYHNWELLIVDDCSTDGSIELIKREMALDSRIKLFVNEKNSGAAHSRNRALREAKGRWIAFLDSDDLWAKDKLEKQIEFMEKNGYKFSYTYYDRIDENSNALNEIIVAPKKVTKRKMFRYNYLGCLTVMYDADDIGLIQIPDTIKKRNDYAMWLKICKKATAYCLGEVLSTYRKRGSSLSHQSKLGLIKHHYVLFKESENMCAIRAWWFTLLNIFYGVIKKAFSVKKIRTEKK